MGELCADEVKRSRGCRPAWNEAEDATVYGEPYSAVAQRLDVGNEGQRDECARRGVCVRERFEVQIGQRVAVDEKKRLCADDVECLSRSAGAAENDRLFP